MKEISIPNRVYQAFWILAAVAALAIVLWFADGFLPLRPSASDEHYPGLISEADALRNELESVRQCNEDLIAVIHELDPDHPCLYRWPPANDHQDNETQAPAP